MGKVAAGFFSFTEITDPREHHSYNQWHQLDHLPEQYPLDGIVFGQRWVCTPECRGARVAAAPHLDEVHYLTLYLLAEPLQRTLDDFVALSEQLRTAGRFHLHRRSRLSGPFLLDETIAARRIAVSDAAVPYRPNRGVYTIVEPHPAALRELDARAFVDIDGVAGCWTFVPASLDANRWSPGEHRITVLYLDHEPLVVAERLAGLVPADAVYAGPFETITPWQWDWFDRARA